MIFLRQQNAYFAIYHMHIFTLCDCTDHDQSNCRVFAVFITRVWFNLMGQLCIEEDNN